MNQYVRLILQIGSTHSDVYRFDDHNYHPMTLIFDDRLTDDCIFMIINTYFDM